ncbi:hypothetical protein [Sphingomonas sp.]|uniref:hypothetical protein n=1 Tax=Sphingomonas sp. TaxID=28214 RepID=UPI002C726B29|nr:hypothetical protein [Sphingomonas sp.]HWK37021.1 hypothetical protein [Sphingomonas sp.]
MKRLTLIVALGGVAVATPAIARDRQITPYIEVGQVLTADLQSGDVLTYSSIGAGVDASIQTRRVEVQLSYKYERRISWDDKFDDGDVHSGLARAAVKVARGVTLEGGAIATRARSDIRGDAPGNLAGNPRNVSQVYSAYAGPTVATQLGDATLSAGYRLGYTKVEAPSLPAVLPGQPRRDNFDDSTSQLASASIGTRAGTVLPVGVTVSGAWQREDVSQLDQRYDGKFARIDAVLPVTPTIAAVAGVGYEKIEISQRDPLLIAGTTIPVTDNNGRFVTDPASPRRLAYQTDGLFWDAGVVWRPSRRTMLEARVGRRYDTMSYTASFTHQINQGSGIQVGVYDSVDSFGRGLGQALANLPTSFDTGADPFGDRFNGCVFGRQGTNAGGCLNPLLGSVTTANFRSRGVAAIYSANVGRNRFGIGAGYDNRRYLLPAGIIPGVSLNGIADETWYGQLSAGRQLSRRSSIDANAYVTYFDSGMVGAPDVFGGGATTSYSYNFGHFGAIATLGLYAFDQDIPGTSTDVSAQGLLGMRYSF